MYNFETLYGEILDMLGDLLDFDGKAIFYNDADKELWEKGNALLDAMKPYMPRGGAYEDFISWEKDEK